MHRQLHWWDVVDRVNYKIGLLVYKCLHGLAPGYLSDQCIPASTFAGRANMRSSTSLDRLLYVPRTKTKTLGPRGFYYAASAVWNSLPVDLRDPGLSLHSFRTKLKSHFFIVDWFFFVFHSCTLLFSLVFLFAVRANVMFISWRVQMSELNWIELNAEAWTRNGSFLFLSFVTWSRSLLYFFLLCLGMKLNSSVVVHGVMVKLRPCLRFRACGKDVDCLLSWMGSHFWMYVTIYFVRCNMVTMSPNQIVLIFCLLKI